MNKTQLEIIDIIEDYMDKTLSKRCLYKYIVDKESEILEYDWKWYTEDFVPAIKIIWHYDIIAVLNYIVKNSDYWSPIFMSDWIYYYEWLWKVVSIPNKPLHLYTDQENDSLLKLLKELWN